MKNSRRHFLKHSALASAGTMFIPSFLHGSSELIGAAKGYKKVVIIQLSGGNDGLNTVVPYRNDLYYKYRPNIGLKTSDLHTLTDEVGINNNLTGLKYLYDEGYLSIINQVGYPNPNRSHFRSMDIWQTASGSDEYLNEGWIGRYLDSQCSGCDKPYHAIEADDTLSLAMKGKNNTGLALTNANKFKQMLNEQDVHLDHAENENLSYLNKIYTSTQMSAEYVFDHSKIYKSKKEYPKGAFGNSLKLIAELIISQSETKVYYTSLTGFDTHVGQKGRQARLFENYSEGLKTLVLDLKENNMLDDTLIMTFSEFGRRVKENASRGTDHGTANNVFIVGRKLKKPGIYNAMPDLVNLDKFDLKYQVDFRNIYATMLEKWMDVDSSKILGKEFKPLQFV
ncbi:MAG: twin-arginine translocation pathway signal [Thalassobius sp.]|nr:twin-arginine translocation pathway signal [Thalassovita sp.]